MKVIFKFASSFLLIWLLSPTTIHAQGGFTCHTLNNRNGLSHNSVTCFRQDSEGLMWVGTWDGLNLFDSDIFRIWRYDPEDPNTISNNIIRDIQEQRPGIIWVATDYGINRIDVRKNEVKRFFPGHERRNPSIENSFHISVSPDGHVFCSVIGWGLAWYDEASDRMMAVNIPESNTSAITDITCVGNGRLLIRTAEGSTAIVCYSFPEQDRIDIISKTDLLTEEVIITSFPCKTSVFLLSEDGDVYRYGADIQDTRHMGNIGEGNRITSLTEEDDSHVIVSINGTRTYRYDITSWKYENIPHFNDKSIICLYKGTQDILWAGTDGQGIIAAYEDSFIMGKTLNKDLFKAERGAVRSFCADRDRLYIGTKGNGIAMLKDGKAERFYDTSCGLSNNSVFKLARISSGDILIGHDGHGLDMISSIDGSISHIAPLLESFGSVYDILEDSRNGYIWLCTSGYGLIRLRLERSASGSYRIIEQKSYINDDRDISTISSNVAFTIQPEGTQGLWIGTRGGGLEHFDIYTEKFTHHTTKTDGGYHISSDDILSLFISRDSTLWIGTGYGLNRLTAISGDACTFDHLTVKDGLQDNTIHGIVEDSAGNLWLSTNKGLSQFNPSSRKFTSYYNDEALQNNEFSDGAYYRHGDNIYFGGPDGFNSFNPSWLRTRGYSPKIIMRELVMSNSGRSIPLVKGERITLKHNENFFEIGFSALEFIDNGNCEFAWSLDNFSSQWTYTPDRSASFTNVPPGTYRFTVRCTNGDKVWNSSDEWVEIRIMRPWWNTILAYIVYIIAFCIVIYLIYKAKTTRIRQQHSLEMESLNKKKMEETYEAKLRFFTNIAHEFMTPLTLICGPIEQIRDSNLHLPGKVEKYLDVIYGNAERMRRLIQELIDFRRIDTGNERFIFSKVNVSDLLTTILDNFSEMRSYKQISLEVGIEGKDSMIISDQSAMEKILFNLISNAHKYTPVGGWVNISISDIDDGMMIRVKNSGKGINPEGLEKVFDRFAILDSYEEKASKGKVIRNGIGMALVRSLTDQLGGRISVESEQGQWAEFTLWMPHRDPECINTDSIRPGQTDLSPITEEDLALLSVENDKSEKATIMIVDDEQQIRDLIADILHTSYKVIQAADGIEAIEMLKHNHPDLIITDLNMPNMNGKQLLEYIKDNELTRHIPVIFLAFKNNVNDEIEALEMGGEGFIAKPFSTRHIHAIVGQVLRNRLMLKNYYNSAISSSDVYDGNVISNSEKHFITQLTQYIEEHITDENLSLDLICDNMAVSRIQLYRKITDLTSKTPSEFIRSVKLKRAEKLLRTTDLTVQEIMFRSGFNNKSYFYREFSARFHVSPKEFRKKISESNQ